MNANSYLIGADPEFAILDGPNIVEASLPQGKLGTDHGGRVVELRPDPKYLASQICADIFRTLNRNELVPYRRYHWKSGAIAGDYPIGGHIHLDIPHIQGMNFLQISALDCMSEMFQTLALFPVVECAVRLRYNYGKLGSVRGSGRRPDGHPRLEYRTPPSWLYSPRLAHLTLSAFKLALVNEEDTLSSLGSPDVRPVSKFRDFISKFAEADDDAAELAPMLAKRNGLEAFRADPTTDIKTAWGIPTEPTVSEPATVEAANNFNSRG